MFSRTLFGCLAGGHTTLREYRIIFGAELLEKYFKFSIIRNPWDRLVSSYEYLKGGGFSPTDYDFFKKYLGKYDSFDEFVKRWVNPKNIRTYYHFIPQSNYLCLDKVDRIEVDYVAKFESLDDDLEFIAEKLGISFTLEKVNASVRNVDYREYYTDVSRNIVGEVYRRDIELLGYTFEKL